MFKKALLILLLAGPVLGIFKVDLSQTWNNYQERAVGIAPEATSCFEALVHIYQVKEPKWKGAFAVRTWIATKAKYARSYTVYAIDPEAKGKNVVSIQRKAPDETFFGQAPTLIYELKGKEAEKAVDKIDKLAKQYPYSMEYESWFGPNQNTFVAHIVRNVDEIEFAMPSNAIGKDYLAFGRLYDRTPTKTGYQMSYKGMVGIMISRKEGFEVNVGGFVLGVNPSEQQIKLPGFGAIGLSDLRFK
jgi:hypothetical protein